MIDLGQWHASPLTENEARDRLDRLRTATTWPERLEVLRLRLMLGLPAEMQREVLINEAVDDAQRAAVELITGQVMLAQRLEGAWVWLDAAQNRLATLLSGPDYITLMHRHTQLRALRLFPQRKPVRPLEELLAIAAATSQLQGLTRTAYVGDARDTLG